MIAKVNNVCHPGLNFVHKLIQTRSINALR